MVLLLQHHLPLLQLRTLLPPLLPPLLGLLKALALAGMLVLLLGPLRVFGFGRRVVVVIGGS